MGKDYLRKNMDANDLKKEKADEFLSCLKSFVSDKIYEITNDSGDSCAGMSSYQAEEKLEKALYDLLGL